MIVHVAVQVILVKIQFTGAVLITLLTASRYWGCQLKQRGMGLQSLAYLGVCARFRGSLPCWGRSASSSAHMCGPNSEGLQDRVGHKLAGQ